MWLDKIISIWSPMMRSTNELSRLNIIWEKFNQGEEIIDEILSRKWKYHKDKVFLLLELRHLLSTKIKEKK